jgi:hypothetical protein
MTMFTLSGAATPFFDAPVPLQRNGVAQDELSRRSRRVNINLLSKDPLPTQCVRCFSIQFSLISVIEKKEKRIFPQKNSAVGE